MTASIDLVAHSGPLEGSRIELRPDRPLLIGRSFRGVHLADPLVSIEHAEIAWVTDYYWVTDLGSLTGTFMDGERISTEAKPLIPGSILRIGESDFRVVVRRGWPPWALPFLVLLVVLGVVAAVLIMHALPEESYDPWIKWERPILTPQGVSEIQTSEGPKGKLDIPTHFIRREGADHRHITARRVNDFDEDGVDELWLEWRDKAGFFDPAEDGSWTYLGYVPQGCDEGVETPWLELRCNGESWRYDYTQYAPFNQEGVVVWVNLDPSDEAGPEALRGITPYRVTLMDVAQLAGFLQARGIVEPVHYLICEEAIPGLRPQVLTPNGMRTLDYGCVSELKLQGAQGAEELATAGPPVAVAFTATGYHALHEDLARYLSGDESGRFLTVEDQAQAWLRPRADIHRAFVAKPKWRVGATKLSFSGTTYHVEVRATERHLEGENHLDHTGRGLWPSPPVSQTWVPHFGQTEVIDPPGCSELHVHTLRQGDCLRRKWCRPGTTFLWVEERGCPGYTEPVLELAYSDTRIYQRTGEVEILAELDRDATTDQIRVLRARVAVRPLQAPPVRVDLEEEPEI